MLACRTPRRDVAMRVVPGLVLTLFVVLAVCAAPAVAKEGDAITVGYSNIAGDEISLWVAADQGYFDTHGLSVDAQLLAGGAHTAAAPVSWHGQFGHPRGCRGLNAAA